MKLGIMQPYFFPYIGYWQLLNAVDKYVIYDDVNFIKGGWINRNRILLQGKPSFFNLPLIGASPNKLINQIQINSNQILVDKNLKTIEFAYKKAPYFDEFFPVLKDILEFKTDNAAKFLENSIRKLSQYMGIKTEIIVSSSITKDNNLKGQDKVLHICEILGATEYYNAIGGQELYNFEDFKKKNIKLKFLKTKQITYTQFSNEFQPNLSIIDVLMFNSKEKTKEMLNNFELITQKEETKWK